MAMQTSRTNEAVTGEADRLRENIDRLLDRLNVGELKGADRGISVQLLWTGGIK